jgi:hypothetical protein
MRINRNEFGTKIWASRNDTYAWAHRCGSSWPCSTLSDKRLFIETDQDRDGKLIDLEINNGRGDQDVNGHELNAFIEDALKGVKS